MKADDIDRILINTLTDGRLSRSERQALREISADLDPNQRAQWRNRAFELVRNAVAASTPALPAHMVLDWVEDVVKALDQPPAAPAAPEISAHFSPGTACLDRITRLLESSRSAVEICVFTITDDRIAIPIIEAHRRGVNVRVITDNDKSVDEGSDIDRLERAGVPVRMDVTEHHMHHKYAIFDGHTVVTGSYNWTRSAAAFNRENIIVSTDPRLVTPFQKSFEELWETFA